MSTHLRPVLALGAALVLGSTLSEHEAAFGQDVNAMARWTSATVVRYRIVAEFSGEAPILVPQGVNGVKAQVTDRYEVEFNWNQQESALEGTPVITNVPTTVGPFDKGQCPAPTVNGAFELATVLALKTDDTLRYANAVGMEYRREMPAGSIPTMNEEGPCAATFEVPARTDVLQGQLPAPPGMMLAMPSGAAGYQHDGKSITVIDSEGWKLTITPTIVR